MAFNHKRADFWLPNFGFKRSLLSLLKIPYFSACKSWAYLSSYGFFMGLSAGGLIRGGAYIGSKITASEKTAATNTVKQNQNPYLKK